MKKWASVRETWWCMAARDGRRAVGRQIDRKWRDGWYGRRSALGCDHDWRGFPRNRRRSRTRQEAIENRLLRLHGHFTRRGVTHSEERNPQKGKCFRRPGRELR